MTFFKPEDVISRYSLEQALEDGFHVDFGFIHPKLRIVATKGVMEAANSYQVTHMIVKTLASIKHPKPNWVVFRETKKDHTEDRGRTFITQRPIGLEKIVYAILEPKGAYMLLTFLLSEEY